MDKSITNYISVIVLLVEGFVLGVLSISSPVHLFTTRERRKNFLRLGNIWKELFKGPFIECFTADTLRRSLWQILTVLLCYSMKDNIFSAVLLVEGFVQDAQRKELIIAPFVKRFKAATLRIFHWRFLNYISQFPLKLHLRSSFIYNRLSTGCSTKGTGHFSFRRVFWNNYLERVSLISFNSTLGNFIKNFISVAVS